MANSNKKSVMIFVPRLRFSIEMRSLLPCTPVASPSRDRKGANPKLTMPTSRKNWLSVNRLKHLGARQHFPYCWSPFALSHPKRGVSVLLMAGVKPMILVILMLSSLMMVASSESNCSSSSSGKSLQSSSSLAVGGTTLILLLPVRVVCEQVLLSNASAIRALSLLAS